MTVRIDVDQFDTPQAPSAATRAYLTQRGELEQKIQAAADEYAQAARQLTKQQIADELRSASPAATKQSLVDDYVAARLSEHPARKELDRLRWHAERDKFFAATVNTMLDESDEADATIRGVAARGGSDMLVGLAGTLDRAAAAQALAGFAADVAVPVNDGHDIREVTLIVLREALHEVTSFPRHLLSNGAGSAHRYEDIVRAVAASQFARGVVVSMMFEQVPADLLA